MTNDDVKPFKASSLLQEKPWTTPNIQQHKRTSFDKKGSIGFFLLFDITSRFADLNNITCSRSLSRK